MISLERKSLRLIFAIHSREEIVDIGHLMEQISMIIHGRIDYSFEQNIEGNTELLGP